MEREGSGKRMAIPTMVTIKEAAKKTGLSYYYIRKIMFGEKGRSHYSGKKSSYKRRKIYKFLERRTRGLKL